MVTSRRASPGTSTPCHRVKVPNKEALGSCVNSSMSPDSVDSPWTNILSLAPKRRRISSAAALAALRDENKHRAPPLDAFRSYSSRSCDLGDGLGDGFGMSSAPDRIPCLL